MPLMTDTKKLDSNSCRELSGVIIKQARCLSCSGRGTLFMYPENQNGFGPGTHGVYHKSFNCSCGSPDYWR